MKKNAVNRRSGNTHDGMRSTDIYRGKETHSFTERNHHASFLHLWTWTEKTVDAAAICGGAGNVVKTETQQTFVNTLPGVVTPGIYTLLEARVYCAN